MLIALTFIIGVIAVGGAIYLFFDSKSNVSEKALALAAMGNFLDAKALIRDKLEAEPENTHFLYLMSRIYSMEKDFLNEANFLEKIKNLGNFEKDLSPVLINNRIADIYYQYGRFEESFFHYLDTLHYEEQNIEALVRLSFMAIGQKEFYLAEKFMRNIQEEDIRFQSYFLARGVVSAMLNRNDELTYFEKAFNMDTKSLISTILYAIALYRNRRFKDALDVINKIIDNTTDETTRYTLFQFLMIQYLLLKDYSSAMLQARLCLEIARMNGWKYEIAESNMYYSLFALASNNIEESTEYLIEAEFMATDDLDIINLAHYKFDLEEHKAQLGQTSNRGYNLESVINDLPEKLFPLERYYEISGLKSNEPVNIKGIVNDDGIKIISKLSLLNVDPLTRFNSLKGASFKNICTKIISELGLKLKRELPCLEADGANFTVIEKDNPEAISLLRVRKWKNVKISDVFLTEMLENMKENNAQKGYIIGMADLTPGAKKVYKNNQSTLNIINDRNLHNLLEKVLGN